MKRTKLQGSAGAARFSKSAGSRSHDLVLDLRNLLSRSGSSLQGMVEKAARARLNGILDRDLVNEALAKVTSILPAMRDVRVTLEEPATQIGRVQLQNYQFEVSLTGTAGAQPTGAHV